MFFLNKKQSDKAISQLLTREITEAEKEDASTGENYRDLSEEELYKTIRIHEFLYRRRSPWTRSKEPSEIMEEIFGLRRSTRIYCSLENDPNKPRKLQPAPSWNRKLLHQKYKGITHEAFMQWGLANLTGSLLWDIIGNWNIPNYLLKEVSKNKELTGRDFITLLNNTTSQAKLLKLIDAKLLEHEFISEAIKYSHYYSSPHHVLVYDLGRKLYKLDDSVPDSWVAQMFGVSINEE